MLEEQEKFSIIIITYNRPSETLDCVQSIVENCDHRRIGELLVINNNSPVCYQVFEKSLQRFSIPIKYHVLHSNLGVAGGRNYGVKVSNYENLFFIDDDAEVNSDILNKAAFIYKSQPNISILAVKSINFFSKEINVEEFPCHDKQKIDLSNFETSHFIGVGHFIRRQVFRECGIYPDDFIYGMEEYDLSYRCIAQGLKIAYFSKLVVLHKKSTKGRYPPRDICEKLSINKISVAYKYLPFSLVVTHILAWTLRYAFIQRFSRLDMFFIALYKRLSSIDRHAHIKLKYRDLFYINKLGNSVLF